MNNILYEQLQWNRWTDNSLSNALHNIVQIKRSQQNRKNYCLNLRVIFQLVVLLPCVPQYVSEYLKKESVESQCQ